MVKTIRFEGINDLDLCYMDVAESHGVLSFSDGYVYYEIVLDRQQLEQLKDELSKM